VWSVSAAVRRSSSAAAEAAETNALQGCFL
jgi:hypothetical protein